MKMIDHNHFICHLILGTFTEYPYECILFYVAAIHWPGCTGQIIRLQNTCTLWYLQLE